MIRFVIILAVLVFVSLRAAAPDNAAGLIYHEAGRGTFNEELGVGLRLNADGTFTQLCSRREPRFSMGRVAACLGLVAKH